MSKCFQSPIKSDGTGIYKQGRILPVKFQLTDTNNMIVTSAIVTLMIAKIQDNSVGNDEIPLSTSNADSGNAFRIADDHYIYNLSTKRSSVP
ncbi:MAG: PxKF domain-containing protein [bacterium]